MQVKVAPILLLVVPSVLGLVDLSPTKIVASLEWFQSITIDMSTECMSAMAKLTIGLTNNNDTTDERKSLYFGTMAIGSHEKYEAREQFLWQHRWLKCVHFSGSSSSSEGDYPSSFCFAHDTVNDVTVSMCLPKHCSQHAHRWLSHILTTDNNFTQSLFSDKLTLNTDISCVASRQEVQWTESPVPLFELALCVSLVVFGVIVSAMKYIKSRTNAHEKPCQTDSIARQLFTMFSIVDNTKALFYVPGDQSSTVRCMPGLRVISMTIIIIGHSVNLSIPFIENVDDYYRDFESNFYSMIYGNFSLVVDTFFVMSGCLTAYHFARQMNKIKKGAESGLKTVSFWLRYYRHRLVRLWPAYAFFTMEATLRYNKSGYFPNWVHRDPNIVCTNKWWTNLLFVNSLLDDTDSPICMPWTWYISNDFLYFAVSPLFLVTLHWRRRLGFVLMLLIGLLSLTYRAWTIIQYNLPPTVLHQVHPIGTFNLNENIHFYKLYINVFGRIGSYLVGLTLGNILANVSQTSVRPVNSAILWLTSAVLMSASLFGALPIQLELPYYAYNVIYGSIFRVTFSTGIAILIALCHTGNGSIVNTILSSKCFVPFSNCTYGAYLFNIICVLLNLVVLPFPYVWRGFSFHLLIALPLPILLAFSYGWLLSVIIEQPAMKLEKILFGTKQQGKTESPASETSTSTSVELSEKRKLNPDGHADL